MAGSYVCVPFGRQEVVGIVWGEGKQKLSSAQLKPVSRVLEHLPPFADYFLDYIDWVSRYTLAPKGMVLKMALPVKEALDKPEPLSGYMWTGKQPAPLTEARRKVLDILADKVPHLTAEIREKAGASLAVLQGLAAQKVLELVSLAPEAVLPVPLAPNVPDLSSPQQEAADTLAGTLGQGFSVTVLDGVTGSGKTEVYFDVIARTLAASGTAQVLVLLPEIALSVQWVERCKARFGVEPHIWHSELTPRQRRETWREIAQGTARLVVGARSALFLPYRDLQLIVVDEEHEQSYKQEEGVLYHGRDMAVARAHRQAIPIVLVSATPSLETVWNMQQGRYRQVQLPERHAGAHLPHVELVDMRQETLESGTWISPALRTALADTLANGRQSLLFLNRRGYAPLLLCRSCGHRFACTHCSGWMVLHKYSKNLQCHHCGHQAPVPKQCPACQAEESLVACGPGVERITEEVQQIFPQARVAVMTSDTMTSLVMAKDTVTAMTEGRIDILVGTQMVAKGYHFPALHLIGIVDADLGLNGGDMRASERTYQLLHQVAGRAGRESEQGRVVLQTYVPEHPVMQALAQYDRQGLEALELEAREDACLPPYGRLAAVIIEAASEAEGQHLCRALAGSIPRDEAAHVLGPAPAPLARLRGRYRYRFLVRSKRETLLQPFLHLWMAGTKPGNKSRIRIDIDPYSFL